MHKAIYYIFFPIYIIAYGFVRSTISVYNITVRSIFTDYRITLHDRWFASLSLFLIAVSSLFFLDYLDMFFYIFDLGEIEYYFYEFQSLLNEYLRYFLIAYVYVFFDYLFYNKFILNIPDQKPTSKIKDKHRKDAIERKANFIGIDKDTRKPIFLEEDEKQQTAFFGSSGGGKTETYVIPTAVQDALKGYGVLIVDPKGSLETFEKFTTILKNKGCKKKVKLVNVADPSSSCTYNPIFTGNAIELKDRIVGSTTWSEEFYKSNSITTLTIFMQAIESIGKKVTFHDLTVLYNYEEKAKQLYNRLSDEFIKRRYNRFILSDFDKMHNMTKILSTKLDQYAQSGLGKIYNTYNPDVNLIDAYDNNEIVYFLLPYQQSGELTTAFGKMLAMDLKAVSGYVEQRIVKKNKMTAIFDEASKIINNDFVDWLSTARSSGFYLGLGFQSLGDLNEISPAMAERIIDNTNNKYIFGVNSATTAEDFSKQVGTKTVLKETKRTEKTLLKDMEGDMGSLREVEEFIAHPNILKNLSIGECLFLVTRPNKIVSILDGDYIETPKKFISYSIESNSIVPADDSAVLLDPLYIDHLINLRAESDITANDIPIFDDEDLNDAAVKKFDLVKCSDLKMDIFKDNDKFYKLDYTFLSQCYSPLCEFKLDYNIYDYDFSVFDFPLFDIKVNLSLFHLYPYINIDYNSSLDNCFNDEKKGEESVNSDLVAENKYNDKQGVYDL